MSAAEQLARYRDRVHALAEAHHATCPRVFGSVVRAESLPGSDIDILVDFTDDASLLDEIGLRLALQDLLQAGVDVVGADTLRGNMRERIFSEAVPI